MNYKTKRNKMSKETAMQKYQDFARSEGREAKKFVDSLIGTKNLNIPKLDDIMDEESRRRENGYYVKGDVISEKGKKIVSTPDDGSPLDKLKCGSPYNMKYSSPLDFKGANSKNSKCWDGYKKVGTKKSPSGTGETVNDCVKE